MVVGKRISAEAYKLLYGEDSKWDVKEYVGLVDLSIMPHLDSPYFPNMKDTLIKLSEILMVKYTDYVMIVL